MGNNPSQKTSNNQLKQDINSSLNEPTARIDEISDEDFFWQVKRANNFYCRDAYELMQEAAVAQRTSNRDLSTITEQSSTLYAACLTRSLDFHAAACLPPLSTIQSLAATARAQDSLPQDLSFRNRQAFFALQRIANCFYNDANVRRAMNSIPSRISTTLTNNISLQRYAEQTKRFSHSDNSIALNASELDPHVTSPEASQVLFHEVFESVFSKLKNCNSSICRPELEALASYSISTSISGPKSTKNSPSSDSSSSSSKSQKSRSSPLPPSITKKITSPPVTDTHIDQTALEVQEDTTFDDEAQVQHFAEIIKKRCFEPYDKLAMCHRSTLCAHPLWKCMSEHVAYDNEAALANFNMCIDNDPEVNRCFGRVLKAEQQMNDESRVFSKAVKESLEQMYRLERETEGEYMRDNFMHLSKDETQEKLKGFIQNECSSEVNQLDKCKQHIQNETETILPTTTGKECSNLFISLGACMMVFSCAQHFDQCLYRDGYSFDECILHSQHLGECLRSPALSANTQR